VREILDHLGEPQDIAAEALAAVTLPADFLFFGLPGRGSALLRGRYAIQWLAALLGLTAGGTLGLVLAGSSTSVAAGTVAPVVNVGGFPTGLAVDAASGTMYIAAGQANALSLINGNTCNATVGIINAATCNGTDAAGCSDRPRTVSVGSDPRGDAYDPSTGTIYVTNAGSDTVSLLNASSCGATVGTVCLAAPRSFPVGSSQRRIAIDAASGTGQGQVRRERAGRRRAGHRRAGLRPVSRLP
jgi:YVTN family beta-propeller protein